MIRCYTNSLGYLISFLTNTCLNDGKLTYLFYIIKLLTEVSSTFYRNLIGKMISIIIIIHLLGTTLCSVSKYKM